MSTLGRAIRWTFWRIVMFKNRKGLNFENQKMSKNRNRAFLAITLICFALILGALSFFVLLSHYDYDLSNIVRESESTTLSETEPSETQAAELSGKASFLFVHMSDDKTDIRGAFYIKAVLDDMTISILPISPYESVSVNGEKTTLMKGFADFGIEGLVSGAESFARYPADRYILITDSGLINALKYLGDLRYNQTERLKYKTEDLVLDIPKGEQLLSPDTVLRLAKYNYIKYKDEASEENAKVLVQAINSYFNEDFAEKSEDYFSNLINYVQSDISAVDFAVSRSLIEELAKSMDGVTVEITDSLPLDVPPVSDEIEASDETEVPE